MKAILATLAALPVIGAVGQQAAERRDRREFPVPGRLVDVGGVAVHVVVEGQGPAVVIESGLGGSSIEWDAVARDLRQDHTVVRYDRPGLGWSPPSGCDRMPEAVAERLRLLLLALDLPGPPVLVGHSLGGLYVRLTASLYPELVSGLVMVDPSHEDMFAENKNLKAAVASAKVVTLIARTAPFGVGRLIGPLYARTLTGQLRRTLGPSEEVLMRQSVRLTLCSVGGLRAVAAELTTLNPTLDQIRELTAAHPVPPIPLTVITATSEPRSPAERTARETIRGLHERQAKAVPNGRLVLAGNSGHLVPVDEPELVARCVRETVGAAVSG